MVQGEESLLEVFIVAVVVGAALQGPDLWLMPSSGPVEIGWSYQLSRPRRWLRRVLATVCIWRMPEASARQPLNASSPHRKQVLCVNRQPESYDAGSF